MDPRYSPWVLVVCLRLRTLRTSPIDQGPKFRTGIPRALITAAFLRYYSCQRLSDYRLLITHYRPICRYRTYTWVQT
ncbi:hypothetical protein BD779DRAFT_1496629 [Infundibulicybe gibba]|nr:hypothetical protein BD779DRAFT_1496629 [Infundibulicybe gibba]